MQKRNSEFVSAEDVGCHINEIANDLPCQTKETVAMQIYDIALGCPVQKQFPTSTLRAKIILMADDAAGSMFRLHFFLSFARFVFRN
jgi:hypothetical protein